MMSWQDESAVCWTEEQREEARELAIEAEWDEMLQTGPMWIVEALADMAEEDTAQVSPRALCEAGLDTRDMTTAALIQVVFWPGELTRDDRYTALQALVLRVHNHAQHFAERRAGA